MSSTSNPGRVAGIWYLLLAVNGPLSLIYIPNKLFVAGDAAATVSNIAAHEWLFRIGMISDLIGAVILIFLVMAFYRLFKDVSQYLAVLVIIFGGVMPALINIINVVTSESVLMIARGWDLVAVFDKPQRDALAMLLLHLHHRTNTAAELLWGVWLIPLAVLVYRSRFLPKFLGVWLVINGLAYVVLCFIGFLTPEYASKLFLVFQPALFGELALVLWLLIKGGKPRTTYAAAMAD